MPAASRENPINDGTNVIKLSGLDDENFLLQPPQGTAGQNTLELAFSSNEVLTVEMARPESRLALKATQKPAAVENGWLYGHIYDVAAELAELGKEIAALVSIVHQQGQQVSLKLSSVIACSCVS